MILNQQSYIYREFREREERSYEVKRSKRRERFSKRKTKREMSMSIAEVATKAKGVDDKRKSVKTDSKKLSFDENLKKRLRREYVKKTKWKMYGGETYLHWAASLGNAAALKVLLFHDEDADVNAVNYQQLTALHFATRDGHVDVAKVLLERAGGMLLMKRLDSITSHPSMGMLTLRKC